MDNKSAAMLVVGMIGMTVFSYFISERLAVNIETPESSSSGVPITEKERNKFENCQIINYLPDSSCTPGAIKPDISINEVCQSNLNQFENDIPTTTADKVYKSYGLSNKDRSEYKIDYLITPELGGTSDIDNLWPEPITGQFTYAQKDEVENFLHNQVCQGKIKLRQAQYAIASNWLEIYKNLHTTAELDQKY